MKKFVSGLVAGVMIASLSAAYAATSGFSDVPAGAWYESAVNRLSDAGIIQGYPDGSFGGGNYVNRAEMVTALNRMMYFQETGEAMMDATIYMVALEDGGTAGDEIGCGDSSVAVATQIEPTDSPLKDSLTELLSIKDQYYGGSGLYNSLYQSNLKVESAAITNGKATVRLTGTLKMGGTCDSPRAQAQLEDTVLHFSNVTSADIYVNGVALEQALSGQGTSTESSETGTYGDGTLALRFEYPIQWSPITISSSFETYTLSGTTSQSFSFLVAIDPDKTTNERGGYWGDSAKEIDSADDLENYCDGKTKCVVYTNDNDVMIAKYENARCLGEGCTDGETHIEYYIYNPNSDYTQVVLSTLGLTTLMSFSEAEAALDELTDVMEYFI